MFSFSTGKRALLAAAIFGCMITTSAQADKESVVEVTVDATRGVDKRVDYAALQTYGPWDDRNYTLTLEDLTHLSKHEIDAVVPIPAFYRVEMRKANKKLPTFGPAQYPRSALNGYLAKYGGYQINGVTYKGLKALGTGQYEVTRGREKEAHEENNWLNFLGGEKRITTPNGAAESAVAINPVNTNLVIAGTNGPGSGQKMWRSTDGGTTWSGPIALSGTCCDPAVGWSPDGSVGYATALSTVVGSGTNVFFYRSTDNGATWTKSATLSNQNQSDKEYLHVDMHATSPHKGNVYVAWHDNNVQKFARSTNGGVSFEATQTLDSGNIGIGSDITSDTAGNVYFFYPATSGGNIGKAIRMAKSTNGGASFGAASTVSATQADFDYPIPAMETRRAFVYVSTDTDRSGGAFNNTIYVSWSDATATTSNTASANHSVIRVAYSRNGGSTWTVTTPHSTTDTGTVDRFNQWLSVDRNGRVFVMYYDTRNSTNRTGVDVYYSMSTDGGQTWGAATRLTTVTSRNISDSFEWGDYNGMDMVMNEIMAIYTDNRDESGGTAQSVDVYGVGGFAPTTGNVAPTANFTFTTSGLTANFTDGSTDSDGTIASRSWNFGDGSSSTATNPSKTYAASGTYTVSLTVTDNGGATNTTSRSVTVSSGNTAPTANFTFATSGLTANFTDGSTDSDGTIASRSWNFGDGSTSTATNPSKTYATAGTYTVTLTVTDNGGATNTTSRSVTVSTGNVLQNGVPVTGLSAATAGTVLYTMNVPAGASNLVISTSGGTGDADLYVRFGAAPTTSTYDCRPYRTGNAETCTFATPSAGTYHIMLRGYQAFSGVTLSGSYTIAGPFFENTADVTISDFTTVESPISVTGVTGNAPAALKVGVTINHTYRGDLKVDLVAPNGTVFVLSNYAGGSADNIIQTFTVNASAVPAIGTWKLRVNDNGSGDVGKIDKWSLQF
ncbi:PKD domain-containing protein [Tahibacter amnicola]|uniref:PKD domain-containing protein n=1 Tax=Tahibacter amnicola TaxID=2976241 RepID=A0ABY6BJC2_9GAMM|nr:PKD domain-containing protein [Tahibacter amnicola]UXI67932.1 PKD domain-containing protein [Tahibacter amnicola]